MTMKIAVLGAGSLGCAMGGVLAEGGNEVTLINRNRAVVDAVNAQGLLLKSAHAARRVHPRAVVDCAGLQPVELVIVLVKSFHTEAAIAGAMPLMGEHTVVLSLQNGLGHEDILAAAVGRARVMAGKTYVGGQLTAPGEVIAGTVGKQTIIGELDAPFSERATRIADVFNRAGLQTTVSPNIMSTIWDKLLVNVATGALSGITRLPYGGLYSVPELEQCAVAAVSEAMAVAAAHGVPVSFTDPKEPWTKAGAGLPAEFKASILQSLEKASRTEIDYINGAVVRWGERVGVATPVNRALVAAIKGIEFALTYTPPKL
jgi:2-dehydropantoate 2-reductase